MKIKTTRLVEPPDILESQVTKARNAIIDSIDTFGRVIALQALIDVIHIKLSRCDDEAEKLDKCDWVVFELMRGMGEYAPARYGRLDKIGEANE